MLRRGLDSRARNSHYTSTTSHITITQNNVLPAWMSNIHPCFCALTFISSFQAEPQPCLRVFQATASHQRSSKHLDRELQRLVLSLKELLLGSGTPADELQSPPAAKPVGHRQGQPGSGLGDGVAAQDQSEQGSRAESTASVRASIASSRQMASAADAKPLQQLHSLLDLVADALSKRDQQVRSTSLPGLRKQQPP